MFNPEKTSASVEPKGKERSIIEQVTDRVSSKVNESRMPTASGLGYESTVGIFGGKLHTDPEGRMVFDMRGFISKADKAGDFILRKYDEHTMRDPIGMLKRHPHWFFRFLTEAAKRHRGNPEEISANIERLGLTDAYGQHEWGIEVKDPKTFTHSRSLQDIYRADMIKSPELDGLDRFEALGDAAAYIHRIHQLYGAIGEVLPSDILFRGKKPGQPLSYPVLNIPDIIYNQDKVIGDLDAKATDLLDFVMSIGFEELRVSEDWSQVQKAIRTILENYQDQKVIQILQSLINRGRLTMQGNLDPDNQSSISRTFKPLLSQHNRARLNFKSDAVADLRQLIQETCAEVLAK